MNKNNYLKKRKKWKTYPYKKLPNHKGRQLERERRTKDYKTIASPYQPLIALKIHGLNSPIKRYTVTELGEKKNRSNCMLPIGDSLALKKYTTLLYIPFLKLKGWKKIFYVNVKQIQVVTREISQWLVLCASTAGGPGLIPGWGTKITSHTVWQNKQKCHMRQRRSLYDDERVNLTGRYKIIKIRATSIKVPKCMEVFSKGNLDRKNTCWTELSVQKRIPHGESGVGSVGWHWKDL